MPTEHERETAFLRKCIRYEDTAEGRVLDDRIAQLQRDDRTLRRGAWTMAFAFLLAVAGILYGAFFVDDFPSHLSLFAARLIIKFVFTLGIGSMLCVLGFSVVWFIYRKNLNRRREECRRRVTQLLELHCGDSLAARRERRCQGGADERQGHLPFPQVPQHGSPPGQ